ncbi:hypothetical protein HZS_6683 [Henneguya salminicola]|nr:hypothetical protein HZS_6683 [Henneguya salminicola]
MAILVKSFDQQIMTDLIWSDNGIQLNIEEIRFLTNFIVKIFDSEFKKVIKVENCGFVCPHLQKSTDFSPINLINLFSWTNMIINVSFSQPLQNNSERISFKELQNQVKKKMMFFQDLNKLEAIINNPQIDERNQPRITNPIYFAYINVHSQTITRFFSRLCLSTSLSKFN